MQVSPRGLGMPYARSYQATTPAGIPLRFGGRAPAHAPALSEEARDIVLATVQDAAKDPEFDWPSKMQRIGLFVRALGQLGQYPAASFQHAYDQLKETMGAVEMQALSAGVSPMSVMSVAGPDDYQPVTHAPQLRAGRFRRHATLIGENGAIAIFPIPENGPNILPEDLRAKKPFFSRPGADGRTVLDLIDSHPQKTQALDLPVLDLKA